VPTSGRQRAAKAVKTQITALVPRAIVVMAVSSTIKYSYGAEFPPMKYPTSARFAAGDRVLSLDPPMNVGLAACRR
jgi:hypothetical protein